MEDHVQADKEGVDLKNISELSVGLLCQNLLLEARKAEWSAGKTLLISVLSTEPREGKARVTHKMSNELAMRGFNILSVNYKEFEADGNFQYDRTTYEVDKNYLNANAPEQMLPLKNLNDYDFGSSVSCITSFSIPGGCRRMQMAILTVKPTEYGAKQMRKHNEVSPFLISNQDLF